MTETARQFPGGFPCCSLDDLIAHFMLKFASDSEGINDGGKDRLMRGKILKALFWAIMLAGAYWLAGPSVWVGVVGGMIVMNVVTRTPELDRVRKETSSPDIRPMWWTLYFLCFYAVALGILHGQFPRIFQFLIDSLKPVVSALEYFVPRIGMVTKDLARHGYIDRADFAAHAIAVCHLSLIPLLLLSLRKIRRVSWSGYLRRYDMFAEKSFVYRFPVCAIFFLFFGGLLYSIEFFVAPSPSPSPSGSPAENLFRIHDNDFFMLGEILYMMFFPFVWVYGVFCIASLRRGMRRISFAWKPGDTKQTDKFRKQGNNGRDGGI